MTRIFISYRRDDSGTIAHRLADGLARSFGAAAIFVDTGSILPMQDWKKKIDQALNESSLVIVVMGKQWLFLQDQDGRRRIDNETDWVRNEILSALNAGKQIIPVLVSGAPLPRLEALPDGLRPLLSVANYALSDDQYWERDINYLAQLIENRGIARPLLRLGAIDIPYPAPLDTSEPLTEAEQSEVLARLPGWRIVNDREVPGKPGVQAVELYKAFKFVSFEDAIHFMNTASRFVGMMNHHPDWRNVWISVLVWLSTWDAGHRPTLKDARLAEYLEKLYQGYVVR